MAAMTSKFNFECVTQYYTDQWDKVVFRQKSKRVTTVAQAH